MPKILNGAIAYRSDFRTREDWTNARTESMPVSCPSGCAIEYDLFVPQVSSGDDALKWVEALLEQLEVQHPHHPNVITL